MTENQAFVANALVLIPACLAGVWLLERLGVPENVLYVGVALCFVIPPFGVALIGRHYERKEVERKEEAKD